MKKYLNHCIKYCSNLKAYVTLLYATSIIYILLLLIVKYSSDEYDFSSFPAIDYKNCQGVILPTGMLYPLILIIGIIFWIFVFIFFRVLIGNIERINKYVFIGEKLYNSINKSLFIIFGLCTLYFIYNLTICIMRGLLFCTLEQSLLIILFIQIYFLLTSIIFRFKMCR